jgi:BMFP domain-containing protein YqiC
MTERPKFFDDLAGVAGGAMSALAGLREELTALAKARVDEAVRRLDLVKREDFDAMAELAQRAKAQTEALEAQVNALAARVALLELPAAAAGPEDEGGS